MRTTIEPLYTELPKELQNFVDIMNPTAYNLSREYRIVPDIYQITATAPDADSLVPWIVVSMKPIDNHIHYRMVRGASIIQGNAPDAVTLCKRYNLGRQLERDILEAQKKKGA